MMDQKENNKNAFTLIELIIVIGIVTILVALIVIAINPIRQLEVARDNQRKAHINALYGAFSEFTARNEGNFPSCVSVSETDVNNCAGDLVPYLASIPNDPDENCSGSGYVIKKSPANRIGLKAICAEQQIITVGDWKE